MGLIFVGASLLPKLYCLPLTEVRCTIAMPHLQRYAPTHGTSYKVDKFIANQTGFTHQKPLNRQIIDQVLAAGAVSQQGLLPTHQDPKLWLVETRTGQEREACIRLMQKSIDLARTGAPLAIKSCFVQDHLQVPIKHTFCQSMT